MKNQNQKELETEIAYEWLGKSEVITQLNCLTTWQKDIASFVIVDSIYDDSFDSLSKLNTGVRVRSEKDATTLTAKRFLGKGENGESRFEEHHSQLDSNQHPTIINSYDLNLDIPSLTLENKLKFHNKRTEVTVTKDDSVIKVVNDDVTYSNKKHIYSEQLLEVEFVNIASELIREVKTELEKRFEIRSINEGKTTRAVRFLGQIKDTPLIENLNTVVPFKMSAHGGKGEIEMKFFHQTYNHFSNEAVYKKVTNYSDANWDFFAIAKLPVGADVKEHLHEHTDEIYFILNGSATFTVDGMSTILKKGDCVLTRVGSRHSITNVTEDLEFIALEIQA